VNEQRESMRKFEQRRQHDNETVVEFEQSLRSLYRKAWPKATLQQKEVALKTRFEEGLQNLDMQQYLRLHAAADTSDQTVQKARIFASTVDAPRPKKTVRITTPPLDSVQTVIDSAMNKRMDKIEGMIRSLQTKPERSPTPPPNGLSGKSTSQKGGRSQSPSSTSAGSGDGGRENQQQRKFGNTNQNEQRYARSFYDGSNDYQSRSPTPTRQWGPQKSNGRGPQSSYNNYQPGPSVSYRQERYSPGPQSNNGQRNGITRVTNGRPLTPNQQRSLSPRPQQWANTNYQQRQTNERPVRCYVCGQFGCHSSFHRGQNTPPPVNQPTQTEKSGCFVCGEVGCHSRFHDNDRASQNYARAHSEQTIPKQYQQGNVLGTRSPGNRGPQ